MYWNTLTPLNTFFLPPVRHDLNRVDWTVKCQPNQPTLPFLSWNSNKWILLPVFVPKYCWMSASQLRPDPMQHSGAWLDNIVYKIAFNEVWVPVCLSETILSISHRMFCLTFITLWANSADDKWIIFSHEIGFDIHANCPLRRQFAWNFKSYFLGRKKKNILKCHLLKFLPYPAHH